MKTSLIIACAGKGARAGFKQNKLLQKIGGELVIERTLNAFIDSQLIDQYVLAVSSEDFLQMQALFGDRCLIVKGGLTRTQSVVNALNFVDGDIVLIHDGARPFVSKKIIKDCIDNAVEFGGAIPVVPTRNTAVKIEGDCVLSYLGKNDVFAVHTPQGFKTDLIKKAYRLAGDKTFNDDGEVYMQYIGALKTFESDGKNVKLTFPEDFSLVKENDVRFGTGFDCHKLVENRRLVLGGIEVPFNKGLLGHSDADVLTHAIMDAILSSLAMRDIGYHFSDKDPAYKDADSMVLLDKVIKMIAVKGYKVKSISATIMAEKPKLLDYIPSITQNLATALNVDINDVGIGATTLEGLGFIGREEGIAVHATAVVVK